VEVDPDILREEASEASSSDGSNSVMEYTSPFEETRTHSYGIVLGERTTISSWFPRKALVNDFLEFPTRADSSEFNDFWAPLRSAWLVHVMSNASYTGTMAMADFSENLKTTSVHLMYFTRSKFSELIGSPVKLMHDIVENYHQLTVLTRQKLARSACTDTLPWHLAALCTLDSGVSYA